MPQSLVKNYIHLVFSTKHRYPFIAEQFREPLYAYFVGICNALKSPSVRIGGVSDHIHLLFLLHKTMPLSEFVNKIKSNSSKWIKTLDNSLEKFDWQNGYFAGSIGFHDVKQVDQYIRNQPEHHKKVSFQDELRQFLREQEIEYDERYIWD